MNAFLWKKGKILRNGNKQLIILVCSPVIFQAIFLYKNIGFESIVMATICSTLLLSVFLWDIDDLINYETIIMQPHSRLMYVMYSFIVPGAISYVVLSIISLMMYFIVKGFVTLSEDLSILYIIGFVFSLITLAVNNGQLYNYRKWVQYLSMPFGLMLFIIPVLGFAYPQFVSDLLLKMLIGGSVIGVFLLLVFLLVYNKQKSIMAIMSLVKGYGELNE